MTVSTLYPDRARVSFNIHGCAFPAGIKCSCFHGGGDVGDLDSDV